MSHWRSPIKCLQAYKHDCGVPFFRSWLWFAYCVWTSNDYTSGNDHSEWIEQVFFDVIKWRSVSWVWQTSKLKDAHLLFNNIHSSRVVPDILIILCSKRWCKMTKMSGTTRKGWFLQNHVNWRLKRAVFTQDFKILCFQTQLSSKSKILIMGGGNHPLIRL